MTEADMIFLKQYVQVMKPIAAAMDFLQGKDDCFIDHVIPTDLGIKTKLEGMIVDETIKIKPLVEALLAGVSSRFKAMTDDDQHHIATMVIPRFKLHYLDPNDRVVQKHVLLVAVTSQAQNSSSILMNTLSSSANIPAPKLYPFLVNVNIMID